MAVVSGAAMGAREVEEVTGATPLVSNTSATAGVLGVDDAGVASEEVGATGAGVRNGLIMLITLVLLKNLGVNL